MSSTKRAFPVTEYLKRHGFPASFQVRPTDSANHSFDCTVSEPRDYYLQMEITPPPSFDLRWRRFGSLYFNSWPHDSGRQRFIATLSMRDHMSIRLLSRAIMDETPLVQTGEEAPCEPGTTLLDTLADLMEGLHEGQATELKATAPNDDSAANTSNLLAPSATAASSDIAHELRSWSDPGCFCRTFVDVWWHLSEFGGGADLIDGPLFSVLAKLAANTRQRLERACIEQGVARELIAAYRDQQKQLRAAETDLLRSAAISCSDEESQDEEDPHGVDDTVKAIGSELEFQFVPRWVEAAVILELCERHLPARSVLKLRRALSETNPVPINKSGMGSTSCLSGPTMEWRDLHSVFTVFLDLRQHFSRHDDSDFKSLLPCGRVHVYALLTRLSRLMRERLRQAEIGAGGDDGDFYSYPNKELFEIEKRIRVRASAELAPDFRDVQAAEQSIENVLLTIATKLDNCKRVVPLWVQAALVAQLCELQLEDPDGDNILSNPPEVVVENT